MEEKLGAEVDVVVSAAVIVTSGAFEVVKTLECLEEASYFILVCINVHFQHAYCTLKFITRLIYHNDLLIILLFRFQRRSR